MTKLSTQPPGYRLIDNMTKRQLLEYANENGIPGVDSNMKKADIYNIVSEE